MRVEKKKQEEDFSLRPASTYVESRRYPRYPIQAHASFITSDHAEVEGLIENASAIGLSIAAPHRPRIDQKIILYSELLGRLECRVVRHHESGFAAEIESTPIKQERLAKLLKWAASQISAGRSFRRAHERLVPRRPKTVFRLRDGKQHDCIVKDLSRAGAAVLADVLPEPGSLVTIGSQRSRVVRHIAYGFAVEFLRLIPVEVFDESFTL